VSKDARRTGDELEEASAGCEGVDGASDEQHAEMQQRYSLYLLFTGTNVQILTQLPQQK
jgi:hypothetical protein